MSTPGPFFVLYHLRVTPWRVEDVARLLPGVWSIHAGGRLCVGWRGDDQASAKQRFQMASGGREPPVEAPTTGGSRPPLASDTPPFVLVLGDQAGVLPDAAALARGEGAAALDGVFAALAVDLGQQRAALVTDRFGLHPLYECRQGDTVGYSTSLLCLARLLRPALDAASVAELLVVQMVLGDRTLARGVHCVPPATVVKLQDGEPGRSTYWDWQGLSQASEASPDVVRQTYALIEQAVLRAVPAAGKVALPLSGGLDSRLLGAILAKRGVPLQAYNVDFGKEAAITRQVAQVLKLPLRGLPMFGDPTSTAAAHEAVDGCYHVNQVWGWDMARRAAEEDGCVALFDGLAFDTILGAVLHTGGGDASALAAGLEVNYAEVTEPMLAGLAGAESARRVMALARAGLQERAREAVARAGENASSHFLMNNRIRKYTVGYCLVNLTRLPGRFPYVTTSLFEHCLRLPLPLRLRHELYRRNYRELFPDLAGIPWSKTGLPLDRYADQGEPRWRLYADAALRRLTRGRWSLIGRGLIDLAYRRDTRLRRAYENVLLNPAPVSEEMLPSGLCERAIAGQRAGRNLGGLLQGLYTVKHFARLLGRDRGV